MLNIIVLMFEVLYYSLFMKLTRREGKFYRYIILFTIVSLIVAITNVKSFYAYMIFVLSTYVGLKYIVKSKVSFYEILVIVAMLLLNLVIELPVYLIAYKLLNISRFMTTIIFDIIKVIIVICLKNYLNIIYCKFMLLWKNNNFYIRYFTSIIVYLYVIITIILLILYR